MQKTLNISEDSPFKLTIYDKFADNFLNDEN